jgi:hypothetical protein
MEETISKVIRIFDKLSNAEVTPTSNYSVPEYWMHRAMRGDEKSKQTLFNWLSGIIGIDMDILNSVFDSKYKMNENIRKNMAKKLIRLTEGDLHKIVKESVNRILNEMGTIVHPGGMVEPPSTYKVYKVKIGINDLDSEPILVKDNATGEYWRNLISRAEKKNIYYKSGMDSKNNSWFEIRTPGMDVDERVRFILVKIK